jgi:signal transduction histidine kinase
MVLAINPETDAFPLVQAAFKEICVSTFSDSAVKLELHFMRTPDDELILLKPDIKRQLSMILIESLNNVLKYAQANTVMVRFQCIQNGRFLLEIQDDGVGFEPESAQKTTSFGLTGMKTRAAKIGADFTIESAPGKGTWVKVSGFL